MCLSQFSVSNGLDQMLNLDQKVRSRAACSQLLWFDTTQIMMVRSTMPPQQIVLPAPPATNFDQPYGPARRTRRFGQRSAPYQKKGGRSFRKSKPCFGYHGMFGKEKCTKSHDECSFSHKCPDCFQFHEKCGRSRDN